VLVSLAAFGTYAALGHPLTAAVAFPSLALFNLLRFPLVMLPAQVLNLIAARVVRVVVAAVSRFLGGVAHWVTLLGGAPSWWFQHTPNTTAAGT
jgi:hypothetical protein